MSTRVTKVYVAGPMTGYPQFNIPAFERQTRRLRAAGFEVVSPVERDSPAVQEAARASKDGALVNDQIAGETWGQILARDVMIVADEVQGIVALPRWEKSKGARLEIFVALLCKKPVFVDAHLYESADETRPDGPEVSLQPLNPVDIIFTIARSFIS